MRRTIPWTRSAHGPWRVLVAAMTAMAVLATACSSSDGNGNDAAEHATPPTTTAGEPTVEVVELELDATQGAGCEQLDARHCLLPFPSDRFTTVDDTSPTGVRVGFAAEAMPANADGVAVDPSEWNRADGFSPNTPILVSAPGVDPEASGLPPVTDLGASLDDDSASVLVNATTGDRIAHWAELDAGADTDPLLVLRPAVALPEGARIVVALRGLIDAEGEPLADQPVFVALRDGRATELAEVEDRREHAEGVFETFDDAGVARDELHLAWDFTVASTDGVSGPLRTMRDLAFEDLGDDAPAFAVTSVEGDAVTGRVVAGTYEVPLFLTDDGEPGSVLARDDGGSADGEASGGDEAENGNSEGGVGDPSPPLGEPSVQGTFEADFLCTVPPVRPGADGAPEPALLSLYGHGLLGSADEVVSVGSLAGPLANVAFCATDWVGMSSQDLGVVAEILGDLSGFRALPDRLLQAHVNFLFLGRLMLHPEGLGSDPAFGDEEDRSMLGDELVFVGNSQGGILGGATSAVATDWERVFLGVPAMNYSTLLERSSNWERFGPVFEGAYPDDVDQQLGLALIQMLWDRGENGGYVAHLTGDPYPGIEPKQVLLLAAFGDHQVANVATETLARSMGAKLRAPGLAEGRSPDVEPFWGIDTVEAPDDSGASYLVVWDFDTPAPPLGNEAPTEGDDPHGMASGVPTALAVVIGFLQSGDLLEVCEGDPCRTPAG